MHRLDELGVLLVDDGAERGDLLDDLVGCAGRPEAVDAGRGPLGIERLEDEHPNVRRPRQRVQRPVRPDVVELALGQTGDLVIAKHTVLIGLLAGVGFTAAGCGASGSRSAPPPSTAATAAAVPSGGGSTLAATVGPGFTITLTEGGRPVSTLAAGTYVLNVDDQASIHNFHLIGPGIDVSTAVGFVGKKSFTVALKPGSYRLCAIRIAHSCTGDSSSLERPASGNADTAVPPCVRRFHLTRPGAFAWVCVKPMFQEVVCARSSLVSHSRSLCLAARSRSAHSRSPITLR